MLLMVLSLSSCLPNKITNTDIIGLWKEAFYSPSTLAGTKCGSIEFMESGKFEAFNIPKDYFSPVHFPIDPSQRVNASGNWKLRPSSNIDPYNHREIELIVDGDPDSLNYNSAMLISVVGEPMLYADIGNLDDSVIFTKNEDEWCKEGS